jgi:catechol 1,2-dioxygenase
MMKASNSRRHFVAGTLSLCAWPFVRAWAGLGCTPAVTNILGPAYRKGAPFRTRLCSADEPGSPLSMTGTVTDAESCKALAGAVLDVWQVNAAGDYDMDSAAFHLRGKVKTRAQGHYAFDTIMPVPYGRRPKHIHYLVTREGYEPRITQCYFAGDEHNATDPYVKKELIITPDAPGDASSPRKGVFDIALECERPVSAETAKVYPDYAGDYEVAPGVSVSIRAAGNKLHWHLSAPENPGDALDGEMSPRSQSTFFVAEYDLGLTFVRDEHGKVTHALNSHGDLNKKIR